jgi:hypothetical protein
MYLRVRSNSGEGIVKELHQRRLILLLAVLGLATSLAISAHSEDFPPAVAPLFVGAKTAWHGFDRYDFLMDDQALTIRPIQAAGDEHDGFKGGIDGQRRCIVVCPKAAAPGNPWSWRGCYWNHQPQAEIELLKRGFYIAYIESSATLRPGRQWDAWYAFLTGKHGFSPRPAFVGMSRGGEFALTWAGANADKVCCVYADNPGSNAGVFRNLLDLATNDVPLLMVCGSIDPLLGRNALVIENIYQQFGGRVSMMIKEGYGHHPHSLRDPKPIADFIANSFQPLTNFQPALVSGKFTRNSFYSVESSYRDFPNEGTYITCRGPCFGPRYDRYIFNLSGVEGPITVIAPATEAPGKPWAYRADFVGRDALVDLGLLARGFYIVTGPVPFNADGPSRAHWDIVYQYFAAHGFSRKPVLEGDGQAAGEIYAWAIDNPEKVSCIYAENPVLRSSVSNMPLLENLAPLAKAGVCILHVCGSGDPWLLSQTRVAEQRYRDCGGKFAVMLKEGQGHYPLTPKDPKAAVDFIRQNAK